MLQVTSSLSIPESELSERFIRASGPGGQNVNKVSTAVQLSFDVRRSPSLPEEVRSRLLRLAGRRVGADGVLTIEAQRFRTRERNREDARDRLVDLIRQATHRPKPRIATRPTRGAEERRLEAKRQRAGTKQQRTRRPDQDA